jgi:hypothetical protein
MKLDHQFFVELLPFVPIGLLIVGVIALFVNSVNAVLSLLKFCQDGKAEKEQQEQLRQSQKANLVAKLEQQTNRCVLIIENLGQSEAKDIQVWVDDDLPSAHPLLQGKKMPTEMQQSDSPPHRTIMYPDTLSRPPEAIKITWTDISGEQGLFEGALT